MTAPAPVIHALEVSDSLLAHAEWRAGAAQLAALALAGPWYQLEYAAAGASQCVPYPVGPSIVLAFVRSGTCESCSRPGPTRTVRFFDGETFDVCARCAPRAHRSAVRPGVRQARAK